MKVNKKYFWLFQYVAGLIILILAIVYFDFRTVWIKIQNADIWFVVAAFSFGLLTILLTAIKLSVAVGYIERVSFFRVLSAILNGKVVSYFAPGTLGADLTVVLSLRSPKSNVFSIGSIVLVDRLLSLLSITLLMLLLLPFTFQQLPVPIKHLFVYMLLSGSVIVVLVFIIHVVKPAFYRSMLNGKPVSVSSQPLVRVPMLVVHNWGRSLLIVLLGLLLNVCIQCGTWFLLQAVHLNVDFLYVMGILPINSFLIMVPVSIMGIGLREGGFYYLLSVFSITMEEIIAFNMIGYFFEIIIIMIAVAMMSGKSIKGLVSGKNFRGH